MVLLPQTDFAAAAGTAERLRACVAGSDVGDRLGVTVSLGVASYSGPDQRSALLKRLDDALYRAKEEGRNCVRTLSEVE